jgi:hypothetical protein
MKSKKGARMGPPRTRSLLIMKGKTGEPEAPTKSNKLKAGGSEPNGREDATREIAELCKDIGEHLSSREYEPNGRDAVVPRWN